MERAAARLGADLVLVDARSCSHLSERPPEVGAIADRRSSTLGVVPVVVFLRGMNLGSRRITNDELIAVFTGAGYHDVSAYQASGNIILGAAKTADESQISATLATALGYDVDAFVRTVDDLKTIASTSPIKGKTGSAGGKPQIVFLMTTGVVDLGSVFPGDHEVHHIGAELHWLPPTGLNELGQIHKAMDQAFGQTTVRTLGTIERLAQRLS